MLSRLLLGAPASLRLRSITPALIVAGVLASLAAPASAMTDAGDGSASSGGQEFASQSDAEALDTAQEEHPETASRPEDQAVALPDGARIADYRSDTVAEIALPDGERALLDSQWPLRAATPGGTEGPVDMELVQRDGALEPRRAPTRVRLPDDLEAGVSFPGTGITIDVPGASASADAVETGGQAFYANAIAGAQDTDVITRPTISGVEFSWQLRSEDSPEHLPLDFNLPAGMTIETAPAGGGLVIKRGGDVVGAVRAPAAWDANNQPVESSLSVSDGRVTMHVPHRGSGAVMPVIADPVVEIWMSWENGGASDYDGWEYSEENNQVSWSALQAGSSPFGSRAWDTSSGSSFAWIRGASGWGAGLAIIACCNRTYNANKRGTWSYKAPRDSYVYRVDYAYLDHRQDASKLNAGIRNADGSYASGQYNWAPGGTPAAGAYGTSQSVAGTWRTICTTSNCDWDQGLPSNQAVLQVEMTSNRYDPVSAVQAGGAQVYLMDHEAPRVFGVQAPTGVYGPGQTANISFTADDKTQDSAAGGLGVRKLLARPPVGPSIDKWVRSDGASIDGETGACLGIRSSRCPVTAGTQIAIPITSAWPNGQVNVPIEAVDATGSAPHAGTGSVTLNVDTRGPDIALTGALMDVAPSAGGRRVLVDPSYGLHIEAADPATAGTSSPGVTRIEIVTDGDVIKTFSTCAVTCAADWTLDSLDPETIDETDLEVRAYDAFGNRASVAVPLQVEPDDWNGAAADPTSDDYGAETADYCSSALDSDPDPGTEGTFCANGTSLNPSESLAASEPEVSDERPLLMDDTSGAQASGHLDGSDPWAGPIGRGWGIADNEGNAAMFDEQKFKDLQLSYARRTVPWDYITRTEASSTYTCKYRPNGRKTRTVTVSPGDGVGTSEVATIDAWVKAALARGYEVTLSIWHSRTAKCHFPTTSTYEAGVRKIADHFKNIGVDGRGVRSYTAWNEPNQGSTSLSYRPSGYGIRQTGRYYNTLSALCRTRNCVVAGGEFSDRDADFGKDAKPMDGHPGMPRGQAILDEYLAGAKTVPPIWAIHPYYAGYNRSVSRFNSFARRITKASGGNIREIWLTEQGGMIHKRRKALGSAEAEVQADNDLRYLLSDLLDPSKVPAATHINRFYLYYWKRPVSTPFDSALFAADGTQRAMYCTFKAATAPGAPCS